MPVLPLVESSSVLPRENFPLRRPSVTMLEAARSLTEPPGLYHSALPRISTPGKWRVRLSRRKSGVLPIRCSAVWPSGGMVPSGRRSGAAACFSASLVEVFAIRSDDCNPQQLHQPDYRDYRNVLQRLKRGI